MGFLDLYADTMERNALADAARTRPTPEPTFSAWAAAGAAGRATVAGGMELLGQANDAMRGMGAGNERLLQGNPAANSDYEKQRRKEMDDSLRSTATAMRQGADSYMPDPLTSHVATQVVAGFSKSLSKAAASIVAAGPTGGAALFGLGEADDTAQRLMGKGIDSGTAWQVGGVVGVASALGARLPISGAAMATTAAGKVAATGALATVGGPLSYMAQEGLSREILQRAGHADEAALHDPTNPIGLGASMFPFVLGGVHLRGKLNAPKVLDRPLLRESDVRAAAQLTPAEQAHSDAYEASAGNLAELRAAVDAEKRPEAKALLQAELDKQTAAAAKGVRESGADIAATHPEAVDAARVAVLDETVARSMPDAPGAHGELVRAMDALGAGERVDVPPVFDGPQPDQVHAVLRTVAEQLGVKVYEPAIWGEGLPAPIGATASHIPAEFRPNTHYESKVVTLPRASVEEYGTLLGATREDVLAHELGHAMASEFGVTGSFAGPTMRALRAEMRAVSREFRPDVWDKYKGHAGKDQEMLADSLATWLTRPQSRDKMPLLTQFLGERLRPFEPITEPLRQTVNSTLPRADQVSLTPEPAAAPAKPATGLPSPEMAAMQKLAEQRPDMPVRLPGDERNTTVAAALERIKAEQAAEASEADLVAAAVECALTGGAAT